MPPTTNLHNLFYMIIDEDYPHLQSSRTADFGAINNSYEESQDRKLAFCKIQLNHATE